MQTRPRELAVALLIGGGALGCASRDAVPIPTSDTGAASPDDATGRDGSVSDLGSSDDADTGLPTSCVDLPSGTPCQVFELASCIDAFECSEDHVCVPVGLERLPEPCRQWQCDPASKQPIEADVPDGRPCNGYNLCWAEAVCHAGACEAVTLTSVAESCAGMPRPECVTAIECSPSTGACFSIYAADGHVCSPTAGDVCQLGACRASTAPGAPPGQTICTFTGLKVCDEAPPCTSVTCDPTLGCVQEALPVGSGCDDGKPCTANDRCEIKGICKGIPYDDGLDINACGKHFCSSVDGQAVYTIESDGKPCSYPDACRPAGQCGGGECQPGPLKACPEDGDLCTVEVCSQASGQCESTPTPDCDDGNECTADSCDPKSGECVHDAIVAACDDGDPCTDGDMCTAGTCEGVVVACDNEVLCEAGSVVVYGRVCAAPGVCERDGAGGLVTPCAYGCADGQCHSAPGSWVISDVSSVAGAGRMVSGDLDLVVRVATTNTAAMQSAGSAFVLVLEYK